MNGIIIETPKLIGSREELKTLPLGAYCIPSERKIEKEWFDVYTFEKLRDVAVIPYAHVLEELPRGLSYQTNIDITVRGDGKVILIGWVLERKEPVFEPQDAKVA